MGILLRRRKAIGSHDRLLRNYEHWNKERLNGRRNYLNFSTRRVHDFGKRKRVKQRRAFLRATGIHAMLIPAALLFMLPFFWMLSTSLKSNTQLYTYPPVWIPNPPQFSNYPTAINYIDFWLYLRNTLYIAVLATLGTLLSCSLVAYSLSRIPWPGRNALFILTVATLMLPFQVTLIPLFVVWSRWGFVNTFVPLIVPHFFGGALYIFLLRQFFMSIPMELSEAARIDGASEFRIYWQIIMPLGQGGSGDSGDFRIHRALARLPRTTDLLEQSEQVHALSWHLRISR